MVFEKIAALLADTLSCDVSEIKPDTKFAELGIDSLDIAELIMNIEEELNVSLEMDSSLIAVSDLVEKIESKLKNS